MECLRMKSSIVEQEGDIDGSLDYLLVAREILNAHPAPATNLRGILLNDIAYYYFKTGDLETAASYLDDILTLLNTTGRGNSLGYLRVAANKAVALQSIGRVTEALDAFDDLVSRIRESGYEQRGAASLLSQYGSMLASVGKIQEAETVLLEGVQVAEAAGDPANVAANNLGLSKVYLANKEFEHALERLDAVLEYYVRDENVDKTLSRTAKVMRAKVLRTMGRLDEALVEINTLLTELGYPGVKQAQGLLSAIIEGGAVHQARGNLEYAEELATDLIRRLIDRAVGDPQDNVHIGRAYRQRAEIREDRGDTEGAIDDFEQAILIMTRTLGEEHKETLATQELLGKSRGEDSL
jgi:tetratricopeptide (TPR) repeat protein